MDNCPHLMVSIWDKLLKRMAIIVGILTWYRHSKKNVDLTSFFNATNLFEKTFENNIHL